MNVRRSASTVRERIDALDPSVFVGIAVAIAVIAYAFGLQGQRSGISAVAQIAGFAQRSPTQAYSAWGATGDLATRSVTIGSAQADGHLDVTVPTLPKQRATDLYITGAPPEFAAGDSHIDIAIDGVRVAHIGSRGLGPGDGAPYAPDRPMDATIDVWPSAENGYRIRIDPHLCFQSCSVSVRVNHGTWQIDRIGFARFVPRSDLPVLLPHDDR